MTTLEFDDAPVGPAALPALQPDSGREPIRVQGKLKRVRGRAGRRSDFKKAIVTLAEGLRIDVSTGI